MILRKTDLKSFYISFKEKEKKEDLYLLQTTMFLYAACLSIYKRCPFVIDVLYYEFTHTRWGPGWLNELCSWITNWFILLFYGGFYANTFKLLEKLFMTYVFFSLFLLNIHLKYVIKLLFVFIIRS